MFVIVMYASMSEESAHPIFVSDSGSVEAQVRSAPRVREMTHRGIVMAEPN